MVIHFSCFAGCYACKSASERVSLCGRMPGNGGLPLLPRHVVMSVAEEHQCLTCTLHAARVPELTRQAPCLPAKTVVPEPVRLEFWMKRKFLKILLRLTCTSQSERAAAAGVSWLRSAVNTLEAVLKLARDQAMRCWQASWALRIS